MPASDVLREHRYQGDLADGLKLRSDQQVVRHAEDVLRERGRAA